MPRYIVHRYETMRVAAEIEAATMQDAIEAFGFDAPPAGATRPQPAEEITSWLVDVGDTPGSEDSQEFDLPGLPSLPPGKSDPDFPMRYWRQEVANKDTVLGYREWRIHQFESKQDDETNATKEIATRVIRAILQLQKQGKVPLNVKTFADLHDSIDANELLIDADDEPVVFADDEENAHAVERQCRRHNKVIEYVNRWMDTGSFPVCF